MNSIKALAGELSPLSDEEEDGEGKEKDKKNMHTQKTQNKAFVAKWIKERTKECDAWRDLMYIPEPIKDPMMEKVVENKPQLSHLQTLLALVVRQKLSAALLLLPRLSSRTRVHSLPRSLNSAFLLIRRWRRRCRCPR